MNTRIISFHNGNIPAEVLEAQKCVFDFFGLQLEQVETALQHPDAIDYWMQTERWDVMVLFDIDCIPLKRNTIELGIGLSKYAVVGAAQHASHIPNSADYVSPAFMVLRREIWELLGRPSFAPTNRADVGGEVSIAAYDHPDVVVLMSYPISVEQPMWKFDDGSMFGIGTNYGNVYHAFESRMNEDARNKFIQKCREVVSVEAL